MNSAGAAETSKNRWESLGLLIVFLLAALVRVRDLDTPFGESFRAVNATVYFGLFDRNLREYGFSGTRGGLVFMGWPGTVEGMTRDVNHPPTPLFLFALGTRLCGDHQELGLRIVPFLASLFGVLALAGLARECLGSRGRVPAAIIAATSPMWAYYGVMVVAQSFLLLLGCLVARSTLRYLEGRGRLSSLLLLFFAGCLLDWPFFFFAPAAGALGLLLGSERRRVLSLLWLLPLGCLAFSLFAIHAAWCMGGWSELADELHKTANTAVALEFSPSDWLQRQGHALRSWYGIPLLLAAGVALLLPMLRRPLTRISAAEGLPDRRVIAVAAFFLVAGGIDLLLFPQHSYDHEFWSMGLAGGLYLLATGALSWVLARGRPGVILASILLLTLAGTGTRDTLAAQDAERSPLHRENGRFFDSFLDPGAIVFTSEPLPLPQLFYIRARVFPHTRSWATLEPWLQKIQRLKVRAPIALMVREWDVQKDPGVADLAARIEALGAPMTRHEDRRFGRFRLYLWDPPR